MMVLFWSLEYIKTRRPLWLYEGEIDGETVIFAISHGNFPDYSDAVVYKVLSNISEYVQLQKNWKTIENPFLGIKSS